LEFYQSSDDVIDSILSKLDMIIEIQEKKMHIEIFGETPLDSDTLKKHLKSGRDTLEPKIAPAHAESKPPPIDEEGSSLEKHSFREAIAPKKSNKKQKKRKRPQSHSTEKRPEDVRKSYS
jgi:hypothetical protein